MVVFWFSHRDHYRQTRALLPKYLKNTEQTQKISILGVVRFVEAINNHSQTEEIMCTEAWSRLTIIPT